MNAELGKKADRNSVICVDDKHRAAAPHVNYDCFEVLHVGFRGGKKCSLSAAPLGHKSIMRDRRCAISAAEVF
jgi:hypothetical protein